MAVRSDLDLALRDDRRPAGWYGGGRRPAAAPVGVATRRQRVLDTDVFRAAPSDRGLAMCLVLLVLIVMTVRDFLRLRRVSAWLMAPYLGWTGYATYLTAGFWWLNPI